MEPRVLQHDSIGEGHPLVLIPGALTGWLSWLPHQERLSDHHRVTRIQPIHNELGSAGVIGDHNYTAFIERESLRLTLDELGIQEADFSGWSRGGGMLVEFGIVYPNRVRTLALIEPALTWILDLVRRTAHSGRRRDRRVPRWTRRTRGKRRCLGGVPRLRRPRRKRGRGAKSSRLGRMAAPPHCSVLALSGHG